MQEFENCKDLLAQIRVLKNSDEKNELIFLITHDKLKMRKFH